MIESALQKTLGFGSREFIERAVKGGCDSLYQAIGGDQKLVKPIAEILLSPAAWKAVGKVEGWGKYIYRNGEMLPNTWYAYMHRFIDALAEEESSKA